MILCTLNAMGFHYVHCDCRKVAPEEGQHSDRRGTRRDPRRVQSRDRLKRHPNEGSDSDAGMK
jgi:hypothetical protein